MCPRFLLRSLSGFLPPQTEYPKAIFTVSHCEVGRFGLVAQLGERCVRIAEVEGSIPFESTNFRKITADLAVIFRLAAEIPTDGFWF